jgi:hypothetical protein
VALVEVSPARTLEIRAAQAVLDAPDNRMRRGDFSGHVVLTLFENPPDRGPDRRFDSPDVKMRIFLADASFNMDVGQVNSDGPVHLTSAKLDFLGTGLDLSYNDLHDRINHLIVQHGRELRAHRSDASGRTQVGIAAAKPRAIDSPTTATAGSTPAGVASAPPPTQYYQARFQDQVVIHDQESRFDGDQLRLMFSPGQRLNEGQSITNQSEGPKPQSAAPSASPPAAPGAVPPGAAASGGLTRPVAGVPEAPAVPGVPGVEEFPPDRSMTTPGDNDLVVNWTGPLVVEPLENKPAELAGPDDVLLTLTGRPVHMARSTVDAQTGHTTHETGSAAIVDYLESAKLIHLRATAANPQVVLQSDKFGQIEGANLELNQRDGVGHATGPGRLITNVDTFDTGARRPSAPARPTAPRQMTITWTDHVDLSFFLRNELSAPAASQSLTPSIAALKHALFVGHVEIQHPQVALSGDQVALDMQQLQPGARPLPSRITADGHALFAAAEPSDSQGSRPGAQGSALSVTSRQIQIDLARAAAKPGAAPGDDRVEPRRFIARGEVDGRRPGQRIRCEYLNAELYNPSLEPDAAGITKSSSDTIAIRTLLATTNVRVDQADPAVDLTADRLVADIPHDNFEFFGSPQGGSPAVVVRPDGTIRADHLIMAQNAQTLHVPGPGVLTYVQVPAPPVSAGEGRGAGRPAPAPGHQGPTTLNVVWHDAMDFSNRLGKAHFLGQVVSDSRSDLDTHHLSGGDLTVTFAPGTPSTAPGAARARAPHGDADRPSVPSVDTQSLAQGSQRITGMVAKQDAAFQSESWADKPGGKLLTRLLLKGQVITFENTKPDPAGDPRQFITVPGPGTLLFEDYRPESDTSGGTSKPPEPPAPTEASGGAPTVHVTGKGATLFVWNTRLVIDAFHNHMTMEDAVQMVHRPVDATDVMELDCRHLTADLKPTGGLEGWMSGHAAKPQFTAIDGEHSVRILAGKRTIVADHLHYSGADESVLLTSDPGHMAQVMEANNPNTYSAETLLWDLRRNRLEAIAPGAGTVTPQR